MNGRRPTAPQVFWVLGSFVAGIACAWISWAVQINGPWWSAVLSNASVAFFLLMPGEFLLARIRGAERRASDAAELAGAARATAQQAHDVALETSKSLDEVREVLLGRQRAELEHDLDVYRAPVASASRASLIAALKLAEDQDMIVADGVRSPIWETPLHFRYVLLDGGVAGVEVRIEGDDGTVLSAHKWGDKVAPIDFYQELVLGVRAAGHDLGTGLNDPTESVRSLSEMLVEVAQLRAQELRGYRDTLRQIIEKRDGWFFTKGHLVAKDHFHYTVDVVRLNEIDWAEHLRDKGWYEAPDAIEFARRLYGVPRAQE